MSRFMSLRPNQPRMVDIPALVALGVSPSTIVENSAIGSIIGSVVGKTGGSTLSLTDDSSGQFAIAGRNITVAGVIDYEAGASRNITIRETLTGASGSPKDTIVAIALTDAELLINGGFGSATGWTLSGTNPPAITGGKLDADILAVAGKAAQSLTVPAGTYQLIFTIDSITTGTVTAHLGNAAGAARSTAATFTETLTVASGANFDLTFALTDAVVDNVSLERLT